MYRIVYAAWAPSYSWTWQAGRSYLDRSDQDRAHLLEREMGDNRRDCQALSCIVKTWQTSFIYIRGQHQAAARLLSLGDLFDRQCVPESLLQGKCTVNKTKKSTSMAILTYWPAFHNSNRPQT